MGVVSVDEFLGALITLRDDGEILSWNRGAETLCGYRAAEALHRSLFDLIVPPAQAEEMRRQLAKAQETGSATLESECWRRDGSLAYVAIALRWVGEPGNGF